MSAPVLLRRENGRVLHGPTPKISGAARAADLELQTAQGLLHFVVRRHSLPEVSIHAHKTRIGARFCAMARGGSEDLLPRMKPSTSLIAVKYPSFGNWGRFPQAIRSGVPSPKSVALHQLKTRAPLIEFHPTRSIGANSWMHGGFRRDGQECLQPQAGQQRCAPPSDGRTGRS